MTVTAKAYGHLPISMSNGSIDWVNHPIKVMLCTSSYVPNQDAHIYKSSITNEVASGSGYTTGGEVLQNKTLTYTAGTNVAKLDADDITWAAATISAYYAVLYDDSGATDASKALIGCVDFGALLASTNGNFTLTWDSAGIITFTVA